MGRTPQASTAALCPRNPRHGRSAPRGPAPATAPRAPAERQWLLLQDQVTQPVERPSPSCSVWDPNLLSCKLRAERQPAGQGAGGTEEAYRDLESETLSASAKPGACSTGRCRDFADEAPTGAACSGSAAGARVPPGWAAGGSLCLCPRRRPSCFTSGRPEPGLDSGWAAPPC